MPFYRLRNLSTGMMTVISRGIGLTKLANAKITPYTIPPITAATIKKRSRLGMSRLQAAN